MTSVEAIHESAHAVVAVRLRLRLVRVSTAPAADSAGRVLLEPCRVQLDGHPVTDYVNGHDRQVVERHIVTLLAGDAAEALLLPPPVRPVRDVVSDWQDPPLMALSHEGTPDQLSLARQASAVAAVTSTSHDDADDAQRARWLALDMTGDPVEAGLLCAWLESVARRLVLADHAAIHAVARWLDQVTEMSGHQVASVIRAVDATATAQGGLP